MSRRSISVAEADGLAAAAHRGQTDWNGVDYIEHPRRVAARLDSDIEKVTALLHDVIEDTTVSAEDLSDVGVPEQALVAIGLVSRPEGQDYADFITRIAASSDPLAIRVKLADLADNTDPRRTAAPPHLAERYAKAKPILEEATHSSGPLVAHDDLGPVALRTTCARCKTTAAEIEIVPPGRRCSKWQEVPDELRQYDRVLTYRLIYSGPGGSSGWLGSTVPRDRAALVFEVAARPLSYAAIRRLGLYDDAGFCESCELAYCGRCWNQSSTGYGTCPRGHGKSLDPHWSPEH